MFRRRWSGLPADPIFASDLKELGYFINDVDEIRSIEDSDYYFKYFLTKNDRWNERQRFAFNQAVFKEIHARLDTQDFTTTPLPLGTPATGPHVPIRTSANLAAATRAVLLFGESSQPLGVLAHRVTGGRGGIARGSVLGLVAGLGAQPSSAADRSPPGVLLANAGELWWWPEGGRGLTPVDRHRVPMASAVHVGRRHDPEVNEVVGNRTVGEHVKGVFEAALVGGLVSKEAGVDVIAVGDTADEVEKYLDDDDVWGKVGGRLGSLVLLGGCYSSKNFKCEGFKRFMVERARAYIVHHAPLDTPLAGPSGNPGMAGFTTYGCPVFSAGEAQETETMLIEAQPAVLKWMQQVALEGAAYKNIVVEIFGDGSNDTATEESNLSFGELDAIGTEDNEFVRQTMDTKVYYEESNVETRKKDTKVAEGKAKEDADATDNIPISGDMVHVVKDGTSVAAAVETADGKVKLSDGPDAQDMKDLVGEIKDLKVKH